jgi:hypothetical protein
MAPGPAWGHVGDRSLEGFSNAGGASSSEAVEADTSLASVVGLGPRVTG